MYFYLKCEYISILSVNIFLPRNRKDISIKKEERSGQFWWPASQLCQKCSCISILSVNIFLWKLERYFYQERRNIWPVLMAGLSTRGKVLQSWPLLPFFPLYHLILALAWFISIIANAIISTVYHQPLMDCPLSNFYQIFSLYHRAGVPYFSYYRL